MIINGGSRSNGGFFARHLMRADQNEEVTIAEIRGLAAQGAREAFREMEAVASGTRCKNFFYHANLNPREDERLTAEQWEFAVDTLERELGLTGQPRLIVEHEKDGRTHRHVVWSRIDADSMTAISDSLTYPKHERAAREIEQALGLEALESVLVRDRDVDRPDRNPKDWESFRGKDSKLDPKAIKAEVTALWQAADNGAAFAAALEQHGYILAKGDRRDFCIIDRAGDEHSLARRVAGVKAADIRARMADINREQLPSVAEGRERAREALAQAKQDAGRDGRQGLLEEPDAFSELAPADPTVGPQTATAPEDLPPEDAPEWWSERRQAEAALSPEQAEAAMEQIANPYLKQIEEHGVLQDGEPEGLRLHERAARRTLELIRGAASWAHGKWQSFVANRRSQREHGRRGPDLER